MGEIIENLGNAGLNTPEYKLLIEKPFGTDLETAHAMVNHISGHFSEAQVYRIDHYLAKEMAQNIITFRARNAMFAQLWSKEHIGENRRHSPRVHIHRGQGGVYEQTGALRDIVQGHLLQLLALTILPLPEDDTFSWDSLPDRRLERFCSGYSPPTHLGVFMPSTILTAKKLATLILTSKLSCLRC